MCIEVGGGISCENAEMLFHTTNTALTTSSPSFKLGVQLENIQYKGANANDCKLSRLFVTNLDNLKELEKPP